MNELRVFITQREAKCGECGADLGPHAWITLQEPDRAICLACAELAHLVYLPAGDTALTRRARKHSRLSAVVLQWSRARQRYERQGVLVEEPALNQAEQECALDEVAREAARIRAAERRAEIDVRYVADFARRIREVFPRMPAEREHAVARHACLKYSGRVGRSSGAKAMNEEAVRLAVVAHIRHEETDYDARLGRGVDRHEARSQVQAQVESVLERWRAG